MTAVSNNIPPGILELCTKTFSSREAALDATQGSAEVCWDTNRRAIYAYYPLNGWKQEVLQPERPARKALLTEVFPGEWRFVPILDRDRLIVEEFRC